MYKTCIRFYSTQLITPEFEAMKEDLIEQITTLIFHNPGITELVLRLCEIATHEEQKIFKMRIDEALALNLMPIDLNVSKYFTLDSNSNILELFKKQFSSEPNQENETIQNQDSVNVHQFSVATFKPKVVIKDILNESENSEEYYQDDKHENLNQNEERKFEIN